MKKIEEILNRANELHNKNPSNNKLTWMIWCALSKIFDKYKIPQEIQIPILGRIANSTRKLDDNKMGEL